MIELEVWMPVVGYETRYLVSSLGKIKSVRKTTEKILSPSQNGNGYLFVDLCQFGVRKKKYVHVIVAEAFIPNPLCKRTVNHKNYNTTDNRVSQLEWFTYSEQHADAWGLGRRESTRNAARVNQKLAAKVNRKQVHQFSLNGEFIKTFESVTAASIKIKRSKMSISHCARGIRNKCGGFAWRYTKEDKKND